MKTAPATSLGRFLRLAALPCLAFLFIACAPPAVVFLNKDYNPAKIKKVALMDFRDYPSMVGSGQLVAGIFEKYLFLSDYTLVDRQQVAAAMQQLNIQANDNLDLDTLRTIAVKLGVDAFVFGQVTDFTDSTDQTVVENMTLEQDTPLYTRVETVQRAPDGTLVKTHQDVLSGNSVSTVDQPVQQTETIAAHVGLSVRMVDAQSGEVLWSASDSENGQHLNDASENVSVQITHGFQAKLKAFGQ